MSPMHKLVIEELQKQAQHEKLESRYASAERLGILLKCSAIRLSSVLSILHGTGALVACREGVNGREKGPVLYAIRGSSLPPGHTLYTFKSRPGSGKQPGSDPHRPRITVVLPRSHKPFEAEEVELDDGGRGIKVVMSYQQAMSLRAALNRELKGAQS